MCFRNVAQGNSTSTQFCAYYTVLLDKFASGDVLKAGVWFSCRRELRFPTHRCRSDLLIKTPCLRPVENQKLNGSGDLCEKDLTPIADLC